MLRVIFLFGRPGASPPVIHWDSESCTSAGSFSVNRLPAHLTACALAVAGHLSSRCRIVVGIEKSRCRIIVGIETPQGVASLRSDPGLTSPSALTG